MSIHAKSVDRSVLELKDLSLLVGRGYVASVWINAPDSKASRAFSNSNTPAPLGCKTLNWIMEGGTHG
jgi:hypothetical protein